MLSVSLYVALSVSLGFVSWSSQGCAERDCRAERRWTAVSPADRQVDWQTNESLWTMIPHNIPLEVFIFANKCIYACYMEGSMVNWLGDKGFAYIVKWAFFHWILKIDDEKFRWWKVQWWAQDSGRMVRKKLYFYARSVSTEKHFLSRGLVFLSCPGQYLFMPATYVWSYERRTSCSLLHY